MHSRKSLFVAGIMLVLAVLFGSAAKAQSVSGSGEATYFIWDVEVVYQFQISVSTSRNGTVSGSIRLTTTMPFMGTTITTSDTYNVEALNVEALAGPGRKGYRAYIWARAQSDQTLNEFVCSDGQYIDSFQNADVIKGYVRIHP